MNKVVRHEFVTSNIILITMEDRENKNTFSVNLMQQLTDTFQEISLYDQLKAVVITGYDNYFSSGGTKDSLLELQAGKVKFTDTNLYSLALNCSVPTISAMQGHGIGGGFVMGLFADFVILSRESVYTTNFMKYGFTPGMGATFIVPKKLGFYLGNEMLMNAQAYRGQQLAERGVSFPIYPRTEVLDKALELASQLSEKPVNSLRILKQHLVLPLKNELDNYIKQEVEMHAKTVHSNEVKYNIEAFF